MNTENIPSPNSWRMTQHIAPSGKIAHIKVESKDRVIFDGFAGDEPHATLAAAAPDLFWALNNLQANPNDPRAHRQALDAMAKATRF
jgi:hypothetical protein